MVAIFLHFYCLWSLPETVGPYMYDFVHCTTATLLTDKIIALMRMYTGVHNKVLSVGVMLRGKYCIVKFCLTCVIGHISDPSCHLEYLYLEYPWWKKSNSWQTALWLCDSSMMVWVSHHQSAPLTPPPLTAFPRHRKGLEF